MNDIKKIMVKWCDRRIDERTIFLKSKIIVFLEMKNPKKYSFLISKIFYILKFEKKSVTFFPPKTFFVTIFWRRMFFQKIPFFITNLNTHTSKVVCVLTKNRQKMKFLNWKQSVLWKRRWKTGGENRFKLKAV